MENNKFNIKVNVKVTDQGSLKHCILIKNVSKSHLKEKAGKYNLSINVKNSRQRLNVVLSINKHVIDTRSSMKRDITYIKFDGEKFDIEIERIYSIQRIRKQGDVYAIGYKSSQFQLKVNVVNLLTVKYYKSEFMPKIEYIKEQKNAKRKNNQISLKKTGVVEQRKEISTS